MAGLFLFKERAVTRVLKENETVKYYVAEADETGECYLVGELYDRASINMFMPDFISLSADKAPEFVECFSENSALCMVFKYAGGTPLAKFLENERLAFDYRLLILKNIAFKLRELENTSFIIQKTVLMPENIVIEEGKLLFNYQVDFSVLRQTEARDVYYGFAELIDEIFLYGEIKNNGKLKIISDKCKKNIYASFGELMKDIDNLSKTEEQNLDLKAAVMEKNKNIIKKAKVALATACLLIGMALVYNEYVVKSRDGLPVFVPIDEIGNVAIENHAVKTDGEADKSEDEKNIIYIDDKNDTGMMLSEKAEEQGGVSVLPETPPVEEKGEYTSYIVKRGDNLTKICKEHYGSIAELGKVIQYNGLENPNLLRVGQEIKLP